MEMSALRQASPHAPPLHLQLPDVLPQFVNMPRILNPDSTREFVMGTYAGVPGEIYVSQNRSTRQNTAYALKFQIPSSLPIREHLPNSDMSHAQNTFAL